MRSDLIRRAAFVLIALVVGLILNCIGGSSFTQEVLSTYLVTTGVMAGGTIAIVFTISLFLLQNTSDLYSSQYLEVYIHNWKEKFVYSAVILIMIFLLGTGLFVGSLSSIPQHVASRVVLWSLVLIGLVFALIDWQYKNVRELINPSKAIAFLEKEGICFLERLQLDAGRMAGIAQARDGSISNELALAGAYNRSLQPLISKLDRQLENLVEISLKLSDKQEVGTTKRGFDAIYRILERFLEARKTSSLIVPSGAALLAVESDSQAFLARTYERLNKTGEKFIKEGKDELATYIIEVYRALAVKAQDMRFVGSHRNENPILDQIVGYLDFLIEVGQRAKNTEVVYQGSRVLVDVAAVSADKGLAGTLHGLQSKLMNVATFGLAEKQRVIVDNCSIGFLKIIDALFSSTRIDRRYHFNDALKNIAAIAKYISHLIKVGVLPDDIAWSFSLSKGYDEFYMLIAGLTGRYSQLTDERERDRYRADLVEFFREVNLSLRILSEEIKSADTTLTGSIGRLLFNINSLIVELVEDDEFEDERNELITRLGWNIHLPDWFAHHAAKFDGGSIPFKTLTDSVAKTGILASEHLENKKLFLDCIKCLYSMTNECLQKTTSHYGYDEPRVLEKACYLGILALKKGWDDVVTEVGVRIYEFEPKYFDKYLREVPAGIDPMNHNVMGLPHHDQLVRELLRWRDDYERGRGVGLRDDAESMMYDVIELSDIDRFIFEVWGILLVGSEIEDEIRLQLAQRRLLNVLRRVLIRETNQ